MKKNILDFEISQKVGLALSQSDFDALIVTGVENVQYLSGAFLPFGHSRFDQVAAVFWPKGEHPVVVCPAEWETTVRDTSRFERVIGYSSTMGLDPLPVAAVLARLVIELDKRNLRLGLDMGKMPAVVFEALREALPGNKLTACDEWLRDLRMVKTAAEIDLLSEVALRTDHGINGSIHHVTVDRYQTALTLAEEIRVHCRERELDLVGYHSAARVASGDDTKRFWPLPPKFGFSRTKAFEAGETARMQMCACKDGYWSNATRIMILGEPTEEQQKTYNMLVALREMVVAELKPGVVCKEVFNTVVKAAEKAAIPLVTELSLGQGVGISPWEAPYLNGSDDTKLQPGMVLVVAPVVRTAEDVVMWAKDTVVITEGGCQLVGWYKDWREPYIPIASI